MILLLLALQEPEVVKAEKEATKAVTNALFEQRTSIKTSAVKLDSFLKLFATQAGLNVLLDEPIAGEVTVDEQEKSLGSILVKAIDPLKATYVVYHGIVVVCLKDDKGLPNFKPEALPGPKPEALDPEKLKGKAAESANTLTTFSGDVDIAEATVKEVVTFFTDASGLEVVADGEWKDVKVTLNLKNVPLHVALRLACRQMKADWTLDEHGSVRITPRK